MTEKKRIKRKYIRIIGNILVLIALVFLVKKFYQLKLDIKEYFTIENLKFLVAFSMVFSVLLSVQSLPWTKIISKICNASVKFKTGNLIYCKSNLYKYIPGNVFQYIGRAEITTHYEEITYGMVFFSIIIETLCVIIASVLVSLTFCADIVIRYLVNYKEVFLVMLVVLIILLVLFILFRKKLYKMIEKYRNLFGICMLRVIIFSILFFFVLLIIQGGILSIIMNKLIEISLTDNMLIIIGIYSFSWLIGYITPGVSGGIGIREALLIVLLNNYIPEQIILVSVVLFRIINIMGDIGAYAISQVLNKNSCEARNRDITP